MKFLDRPAVHIFLIALLGLLAYSNTFNVPFQWDEHKFIVDNPIVKDLFFFLDPSKAEGLGYYGAFKNRYVSYFTFALNYKIHGLDVTGYHAVNIAIHLINACLVYLLVVLTFRTPVLKVAGEQNCSRSGTFHTGYIALFTALMFVSHPVQTEAVTYVFQRHAALAAFFYLSSLTAYIGSRLSAGKPKRYVLYGLSLFLAVLAMKTKENAATLPVAIALYEFIFFRGSIKARVIRLIPILMALSIIPLTLTGVGGGVAELIDRVEPATRGAIARKAYLFTQFRVIVTYIRLLFCPVNQNIYYDYPVFNRFFDPEVLFSFLFALTVFCVSLYLLFRSRRPEMRLVACGILWFFLTLSVESSIIPLPMVINEYRVYLPSVGFFFAITTAVFLLSEKSKKARAYFIFPMIIITVSLAASTYKRNGIWESEISLWQDVIKKSPEKAEAYNNLGSAYTIHNMPDQAIESYLKSLRLNPYQADAYSNLGEAYFSRGLVDKAIAVLQIAVKHRPDHAAAHNNLGDAYLSSGQPVKAVEHYHEVIRLAPYTVDAYHGLALAYLRMGLPDKANEYFQKAESLWQRNEHLNLWDGASLKNDAPYAGILPRCYIRRYGDFDSGDRYCAGVAA